MRTLGPEAKLEKGAGKFLLALAVIPTLLGLALVLGWWGDVLLYGGLAWLLFSAGLITFAIAVWRPGHHTTEGETKEGTPLGWFGLTLLALYSATIAALCVLAFLHGEMRPVAILGTLLAGAVTVLILIDLPKTYLEAFRNRNNTWAQQPPAPPVEQQTSPAERPPADGPLYAEPSDPYDRRVEPQNPSSTWQAYPPER